MTRASTRANPNTEDICHGALTDYQLLEIRTLMPAKGPPRVNLAVGSLEFAHDDEEPPLTSTALMYATGTLSGKGFAEEEKQEGIIIPSKYEDAMNSRQRKQWLGAIDKETKSLQEHEVYDLVLPLACRRGRRSSAPVSCLSRRRTTGSRIDFSSKATSRSPASTSESRLHQCAALKPARNAGNSMRAWIARLPA